MKIRRKSAPQVAIQALIPLVRSNSITRSDVCKRIVERESREMLERIFSKTKFIRQSSTYMIKGESEYLYSDPKIDKITYLVPTLWYKQICSNRVPTRLNLSKRGILVDTLCPVCGAAPESEDHVFRSCHIAKYLIQKVKTGGPFLNLQGAGLSIWSRGVLSWVSKKLDWNLLMPLFTLFFG